MLILKLELTCFTVTYLFCLLCLLLSHMPGYATEIAPGAGEMAQLSVLFQKTQVYSQLPYQLAVNTYDSLQGVLHLWAPQSPALMCTQLSQKHIM